MRRFLVESNFKLPPHWETTKSTEVSFRVPFLSSPMTSEGRKCVVTSTQHRNFRWSQGERLAWFQNGLLLSRSVNHRRYLEWLLHQVTGLPYLSPLGVSSSDPMKLSTTTKTLLLLLICIAASFPYCPSLPFSPSRDSFPSHNFYGCK